MPRILIFVLSGVLLVIAAVAFVPDWWVGMTAPSGATPADKLTAVAAVRQSILLMAGGVLALVGIYYSHQRYRIDSASNALQQDANYTDRYSAAILQLGSAETAVRLGGIYALERIGKQSLADRATVGEVLAAFIRSDAKRAADEIALIERARLREYRSPIDIKAAFTVIARMPGSHDRDGYPLDLTGVQLPSISLPRGANLSGVNLSEADLRGAHLRGVNVSRSVLARAALDGADFSDSNLEGCDLSSTKLFESNLSRSNLARTRASGAQLQRTMMVGANLLEAHFGASSMVPAANPFLVESTTFLEDERNFSMTYTYLAGADLSSADLSLSQLDGLQLTGATLNSAVFLQSTGWEPNTFEVAAAWDRDTRWPAGYTPAAQVKP